MKKAILFFSSITIATFIACGPAAENREAMHKRAKEFQDSIANSIKTALQEVEATPNAVVVQQPADTTKKTK